MNKYNPNINKIATHPLQTIEWANFRKEWGNEIITTKYGIITVHPIPYTKYKIGAYIKGIKPTSKMLLDLKQLGQKNNIISIKMEPNVITNIRNINLETIDKSKALTKDSKVIKKLLSKHGAIKGKTLFTPTSFWIDLKLSEDDLLSGFSQKTRYNIRLALKKGVIVKEDNSDNAFSRYLSLTRETVERQRYYAHTEKYHRLMWKNLNKDMVSAGIEPIARILTAKYKNKIITTWIVFVWKDTIYYPYGASTHDHKDVMANNLMMWEAIKYGKKLGLKIFDLWGREEGKGFTKFKEGYNPKIVDFLGTYDLVINKNSYKTYLLLEKLRWIILRTKSKFVKPSF